MTRSPPVWPYALAVSLLLHAALLIVLLPDAPPPIPETPPGVPIEARLIRVPPPVPAARPRPAPRPAPRPVAPVAAPAPAVGPEDGSTEAAVAEAPGSPGEAVAAETAVEDGGVEPALPAASPAAAASPRHPLPPRIDMRFDVRYGFARGEQTLTWVSDGESYTVSSVAAASGLAGVFYRGRFVQTSSGRVAAQGLVPDTFWDQRGDRRSVTRFDAARGVMTYTPAQGAPRHDAYQGDVQDSLSLFFHLALNAPPAARMDYQVFNGRRLRHYAYETRGEVVLDTALGPLRTLHLVRAGDFDGRFELWLAIDRHYLPVRVLRTDDKGNDVELAIRSIAP
ncbi:MAG: DUF3108 domain-containing protein [Pseudomonadota bacterium]